MAKVIARDRALERLPDRILADIGLDASTIRRRGWNDYLQELTRHIGPTRS